MWSPVAVERRMLEYCSSCFAGWQYLCGSLGVWFSFCLPGKVRLLELGGLLCFLSLSFSFAFFSNFSFSFPFFGGRERPPPSRLASSRAPPGPRPIATSTTQRTHGAPSRRGRTWTSCVSRKNFLRCCCCLTCCCLSCLGGGTSSHASASVESPRVLVCPGSSSPLPD